MDKMTKTPAKKMAKSFLKLLKKEEVDYSYLREVFRHLRQELDLRPKQRDPKKLPFVPSEQDIQNYYKVVWTSQNVLHMVMIKTLLYTGVRVSELINIKMEDVNLHKCQMRINKGKGNKDRIVPFPVQFREVLASHMDYNRKKKAVFLFESSWKRPYSDRGVRKLLAQYSQKAGLQENISPHKLRHFLFTWMKTKGVDDALIQPFSGHESRQSLEIYSKLSITDAQKKYDDVISSFPI